jgi:hypothetical protein
VEAWQGLPPRAREGLLATPREDQMVEFTTIDAGEVKLRAVVQGQGPLFCVILKF